MLNKALSIGRRSWIIIAAGALLGVSLGLAYIATERPMYTATAQSFVSTNSAASVSDLAQGNVFLQQIVRSYATVADSPLVLNRVRQQLALKESTSALQRSVSTAVPLNTVILSISAIRDSPSSAAQVANAVNDQLSLAVPELTGVQSSSAPIKISVIERATPPQSASSPNVPVAVALGLLLGLAIGIAVAALREIADTRLRSVSQLALIAGVPLLGTIPFDRTLKDRAIVVSSDTRSPTAEAVRALRTNLKYVDIEHDSKSLVIASSVPAEGKSFTAIGLAAAFAASGQRTLLVDADLRRPRVATYLGIEGSLGLTDLLANESKFADVRQFWGQHDLHVLPSGGTPPNPSELLESQRMRELIDEFSTAYDVVIYDVPPLLAVTDAAILAANTSGAVLVAGFGRVRTTQVRTSIERLGVVRARLLGVVGSMVPLPRSEYGYAYYSSNPEESHVATVHPQTP